MRLSITYLIPLITFRALSTLVIQRRHLLIALLALEGVILTLTILIIIQSPQELFFALVILTFGACEARLGLACLVAITRSYGNDLFNSIIISKC